MDEFRDVEDLLAELEENKFLFIDFGVITDEEIEIIEDADGTSSNDFDYPRLGQETAAVRKAAVDAVLHVLLARGDVAHLEDGSGALQGRYAVISECRRSPTGLARVEVADGQENVLLRAALYPVGDVAVLIEEVDNGGFHHFRLVHNERASEWLLESVAEQVLSEAVEPIANAVEALGLESILGRATQSGFVVASNSSVQPPQIPQRAWSLFCVDGALIVAEGLPVDSGSNLLVEVHSEQSAREWSRSIVRYLFGDASEAIP